MPWKVVVNEAIGKFHHMEVDNNGIQYAEVISTTFHALEHKTFSVIPVRSTVRETVARWIDKKESEKRIWQQMKIQIASKPYKPKK